MRYPNTVAGIFLSRPNRFIAHIEINGKEEICHVKIPAAVGNCCPKAQRSGAWMPCPPPAKPVMT